MTAVVRELDAAEVARGVTEGRILLVDVREPGETMRERIPSALLLPMSAFDPSAIPVAGDRTVVFTCASGIRSVYAAEIALAHGFGYDAHLAGGIKAWKAAGLPTES